MGISYFVRDRRANGWEIRDPGVKWKGHEDERGLSTSLHLEIFLSEWQKVRVKGWPRAGRTVMGS